MFTWVIGKIKHLRGFKGVILLSIISFAINAITPYLNGILFTDLALEGEEAEMYEKLYYGEAE